MSHRSMPSCATGRAAAKRRVKLAVSEVLERRLLLSANGITLASTGTGGLPPGSDDPYWSVDRGTINGDPHAQVVSSAPGAWTEDGNAFTTSQWIAPQANQSSYVDNSQAPYNYTASFYVYGDPSTATISGHWAADDSARIFLNGQDTGIVDDSSVDGVSAYAAARTFTLPTGSPFKYGLNTVDFQVTNTFNGGGSPNPTGLVVRYDAASVQYAATSLVLQSIPGDLEAELSAFKQAMPGQTITFYINGSPVGSVATDIDGVALMPLASMPPGTYDITASYAGSDAAGLYAGNGSTTLVVNPPPAPTVTAAHFNSDGSAPSLTFSFSEDVSGSLSASAIQVEDAVTGTAVLPTSYSYDSASNTATFVLPSSLRPSEYRASLPGSVVTNSDGVHLDGRGDGTSGSDYTLGFSTLSAGQQATFDLAGNWSSINTPNGLWSLQSGNTPLDSVGDWQGTGQSGWALTSGGIAAPPFWAVDSALHLPGAQPGDVVVNTAGASAAGGTAPADVSWTSPDSGLVSISGGVWLAKDTGNNSDEWELFDNGRILSGGSLTSGTNGRSDPFSLDAGTGGAAAITNVPVHAGDTLQLELTSTSGASEYLGVNFAVHFTFGQTPTYTLGSLPNHVSANGQPVSFYVRAATGGSGPISMRVDMPLAAPPMFDPTTGLFSYTPDTTHDRFDFNVTFSEGDGSDAATQVVAISPLSVEDEYGLVSPATTATPAPNDSSYTTVQFTGNGTVPSFNGQPNLPTRNVEISGKEVDFIPGNGGLFDELSYTDPSGQDLSKPRNIANLSIYAETVVIAGHLWLPQTNVVIDARQLVFEDTPPGPPTRPTPPVFGRIDTTPLPFLTTPGQSQNGSPGENAGNITLHVQTISSPTGVGPSTPKRFILRGGTGQAAGSGQEGTHGSNMEVVDDQVPDAWLYGLNHLRNVVYYRYVADANDFLIYGSQTWPGDGQPATPGGTPGNGGTGGTFTAYGSPNLAMVVDASGGAPGSPAIDPNTGTSRWRGGAAGSPQDAMWAQGTFVLLTHHSNPGADWIAPSGSSGAAGNVQVVPANQAPLFDWLHPAALQAMVAYAKDAYLDGNLDDAQREFPSLDSMVSQVVAADTSPFLLQFQQEQPQIAQFDARAAANLDYFGNPPGWVPLLSFAVNSEAYQQEIPDAIRTEFLAQVVEAAAMKQQTSANDVNAMLGQLNSDVTDSENQLASDLTLLSQLPTELGNVETELTQVQQHIAAKQQELEVQAQNNVEARHQKPFWEEALGVLGAVATALTPVFGPVAGGIGTGLTALSNITSEPLSTTLSGIGGLVNAFSQSTIDDSVKKYHMLLDNIGVSKFGDPTTSIGQLKTDEGILSKAEQALAPALQAFSSATQASQAPQSEVAAELQSLEATDPQFQSLVAEVQKLDADKATFQQDLNQITQQAATATSQITSDYTTAADLSAQLSAVQSGLNLDLGAVQQVRQMAQDARDKLLEYQYYVAKSYEYQTLTPYTGSFHIQQLLDKISSLLGGAADPGSFLNDNYQQLAEAYNNDLSLSDLLNTTVPQQEQILSFHLTPQQLDTLNSQNQVTINLVDMGVIPASELEGATINSIGATSLSGSVAGDPTTLTSANVVLQYSPSATSVMQTQGQRYYFRFTRDTQDAQQNPIFWTTSWNALPRDHALPVPGSVAPQYLSLINVLTHTPTGTGGSDADQLFAHPGLWSDITISKAETADVTLTDGIFDVDFNYVPITAGQSAASVLQVQTSSDLSPKVLVGETDNTGRTDGVGAFVRTFAAGQSVTLTAQPQYGSLAFLGWQDAQGNTLGTTPAISLTLSQGRATIVSPSGVFVVHPIYADLTPQNVQATSATGPITLSWNASQGATTYNVYRSTSLGGEIGPPLATGITATTFVDRSASAGTTYYYIVTAVANGYESRFSNEASGTMTSGLLPGDANADGRVDFSDLLVVAQNYGKNQLETWSQGDFNGDGTVNFSDLLLLAQNYGHSLPASGTLATSPSTLTDSDRLHKLLSRPSR